MRHRFGLAWRAALAAGLLLVGVDRVRAAEPDALYAQHCAACHAAQRTRAMGPALLPESLERLRRAEALKVITQGRVATQMLGFRDKLSAQEIAALAAWTYTPVSPAPMWADADIRASRVKLADLSRLPNKPAWAADPMNLFVAVSAGGELLPAHSGAVRLRAEPGQDLRCDDARRQHELARLRCLRRRTAPQLHRRAERHRRIVGDLVRAEGRGHLRRPGARLPHARGHFETRLPGCQTHPPG